MLETLEDYLVGLVVGMRYRPNFSVEDQLGKIMDDILYGREAFFNPQVFPMVEHGLNGKTELV